MKKLLIVLVILVVGLVFIRICYVRLILPSSDYFWAEKIVERLQSKERQKELLDWVDNNIKTEIDNKQLNFILGNSVLPGKCIQPATPFLWERFGLTSPYGHGEIKTGNEIRIWNSETLNKYTAVYFGGTRFGIVVFLETENQQERGELALTPKTVILDSGRILVIHAPDIVFPFKAETKVADAPSEI